MPQIHPSQVGLIYAVEIHSRVASFVFNPFNILDRDRLAGAALLAPVINFWWPGFPHKLSAQVFEEELVEDRWASRVAYYAPWLVHWWNTQKWFPSNSVIAGRAKFTAPDLEILSKQDLSSVDLVCFSVLIDFWS